MAASTRNARSNDRKDGAEEKPKPVWSRKYFTGSGQLEVAIWRKEIPDQERIVFNTSVKRTYKDGESYKESRGFRAEELPLVAAALQQAFDWISVQTNKE